MNALQYFLTVSQREFDLFIQSIDERCFEQAKKQICDAENNGGRLHITGVGKPSHVASYMASLFSSVGTPTYFLDAVEALHGSCGQLIPGDVVIVISNSGETAEMKSTVTAIKRYGCGVIGVSGNRNSWLQKHADTFLFAGVQEEGGPLNRAPRSSILAEILLLQALSVLLQERCGLTPGQYMLRHPGGMLGQPREGETD